MQRQQYNDDFQDGQNELESLQRGHDYTNTNNPDEPKKKKKWGMLKGAMKLGGKKK